MDNRIRRFVYKVRARLREQQIITTLLFAAGAGLLIAVSISLLSLMIPFYYAALTAAGVIILSCIAGFAVGICKTPDLMESALKVDAKGHKEKITTAFFLKGKEDVFSVLQKKSALKVIDNFQIRKEFPIRLSLKQVVVVLGLAVVFVVSSMMDTPAREKATTRHEVAKEAKEDIARLEKVEKKLEEKKDLFGEEANAIKEQIEQAKRELKEADSRQDLKKAEERITKKMELAQEKTENKALGEMMSEAVKEEQKEAAKKEENLVKEAAEALAKAEKGSGRDKQEAYKKLKKLAETMGAEGLAKAAEEYKESGYSDSDYNETQRALVEALSEMQEGNTDLADNSENNKNGQQSTNKGNSGQNNQNQGKNQNSNGQSNNGNSNQNNNQNGNNNSGNGQNGSGQNGSGQNGGAGAGSGGGWNRGSKEGKEGAKKTNENITIPEGENGEDENLTGKANGNNSSTKQKSSQSRTWSGNKVSYGEVSGKYKEKAYKKVNGSNYPSKMKDKIKNYFEGLN